MKRFVIGFLLFGLLLLPQVLGLTNEEQLTAQQNRQYDIKVGCSSQGWFCSPSVMCNLTLAYQNSTPIVNNQQMSITGSNVNYTLTGTQTANLGRYIGDIKCLDPNTGLNDTTNFNMYITPSGKVLTDGENWILLGSVILLMFLAVVFLLMALLIPLRQIKVFLFGIGLILLIGSVMININLLQNYIVNNESLTKGIEYIFIALEVLGIASFVLLLVFTVVQTLKYLRDSSRFPDE